MLFHSSIRRELARTFAATLFVLVVIVMTMMLIRTLNLANKGTVNPSEVSLMLGYTMLAYFPTLLTLGLFVSTVGTLSRMYRDSEMAVWFTSGQGLAAFARPILRFAWPVLAAIAVLSLWGWPWGNAQMQELRVRYVMRGDLERLAPGRFQESGDGTRVLYIDTQGRVPQGQGSELLENAAGSQIFVYIRQNASENVITARAGDFVVEGQSRYAVLQNGQSAEFHNDASVLVRSFERYGLRMGDAPQAANGQDSADPSFRTTGTLALLRVAQPRARAELGWRVGMAFAGLNFLLLALASSSVNPRSGRSANLIFALLAFVIYYNLINFAQSWVASGAVSLGASLALLHGGVLALCALWIAKRHRQWSLRSLLLRRSAAGQA